MPRALVFIIVLCQPLGAPSQSLIEEAVSGLLGRTAKIGRNVADWAQTPQQEPQAGGTFLQGLFPQPRTTVLRPQDGTVVGGLFRGLLRDVDDEGNVNKQSLLHPDQHQLVGGLVGGFFNGRANAAATTPTPKVVDEDVPGLLESMMRHRRLTPPPPATPPPPPPPPIEPQEILKNAYPPRSPPPPPPPPPATTALDEFRQDVERDAPECSQKAKAQLSKVLGNFRKGVLECVGVEDADLGDVITRLRQVLLTADRLPTNLMHKLGRCAASVKAGVNETAPSSAITRIPPRRPSRRGDPSEVSAARCVLQALADARDHLHKIPTETAAFSRRVAFLLAGTKSDSRVRACVASQLTSMAHPIVATARQMAGCVMVGPDFTTE